MAFDAAWPQLSGYVRNLLASRGVYGPLQDDITQETGLRLFQAWERVDSSRPVNPLAATIALNLLRDEVRRNREVVGEVPERPALDDVERLGMARLELQRVGRALGDLSTDHRLVLLHELADEKPAPTRGRAATKMLRMRARRRLAAILEAAGGFAAVAWVRLRRVAVPEPLAAATTALLIAVPASPPILHVDPATTRPAIAVRGWTGPGESRTETAPSMRSTPHRGAARATTSTPVVAASSIPTADRGGDEPLRPYRVGAADAEAAIAADVTVNGTSVRVGQTGNALPVCVGGAPVSPRPVSCPATSP